MKRSKIVVNIILLISIGLVLGILITNQVYSNTKEDTENSECSVSTTSVSFDSIAMMLETGEGTGQYYPSSSSMWPSTDEYTFNATASRCENGSTVYWDSDTNQVIMNGTSSDRCYIYFDVATSSSGEGVSTVSECSDDNNSLACYIMNLYTEDGTDNMYYFDGEGTYTNADLEANDLSYRYSGASDSTNNYVCFGGDDCTDTDNLYRIIGVFKNDDGEYEIKLIKYDYCISSICGTDGDYYGTYSSAASNASWSTSYYLGNNSTTDIGAYCYNKTNYSTAYSETGYRNVWSYSELNMTNLNDNYLNYIDYLGETWSSMITTHTWIVGGATTARLSTSSTALLAYLYEIEYPVTTQVDSTYNSKIGLIYISDYYYAVSPTYWSYVGYDGSNGSDYRVGKSYNWMFMGASELVITRSSSTTSYAMYISCNGHVSLRSSLTLNSDRFAIRPTFYLSSSVEYVSGLGTIDSPIIISE